MSHHEENENVPTGRPTMEEALGLPAKSPYKTVHDELEERHQDRTPEESLAEQRKLEDLLDERAQKEREETRRVRREQEDRALADARRDGDHAEDVARENARRENVRREDAPREDAPVVHGPAPVQPATVEPVAEKEDEKRARKS